MLPAAGLLALAATASAAYQGFNYGSTFTDGSPRQTSDFEALFKNAQGLANTNGAFSSARLYTMVQAGTQNTPISAIQAAINTKTSLLLGLWASGGDAGFANELAALTATISQYGSQLSGLIAGISVGSEDLYRISPIGIANKEYAGAEPDTLVGYIKQVRAAIANTPLSGAPIGHVDTWTAYVNASNAPVISACDWIGVDAYPYFQDTMPNSIDQGASLFNAALSATQGAAQGKPVWVTETGWPTSGKTTGAAVPSVQNAKTYWDDVGCPMFGKTNVWWYTMQDASPATPNPSFGLVGSTLTTTPYFDLSCANVAPPPAASSSSSSTAAPPASTVSSSAPSTSSAANIGSPGANGQGGSNGSSTSAAPSTSTTGASSPGNGSSGSGSGTTTMATQTTAAATATGASGSSTSAPPTVSGNAAAAPAVPFVAVGAAALLAFAL